MKLSWQETNRRRFVRCEKDLVGLQEMVQRQRTVSQSSAAFSVAISNLRALMAQIPVRRD